VVCELQWFIPIKNKSRFVCRLFSQLCNKLVLGNEQLSLLTMNRKYKLRVELEDFEGASRWAEYSTFYVNPVTDNYRLTVEGYSGDAGICVHRHGIPLESG